jgi:peptidoglycan/LPS O-acetylase OafA/YrhL
MVDGITLPMLRRSSVADYVDALGFCLLVAGFWRFADVTDSALGIRWLGSRTFVLYLFHRPLIQILAVLGPDDPASIERRLFILVGTVLIVATFGHWCEAQKAPVRTWLTTNFVERRI